MQHTTNTRNASYSFEGPMPLGHARDCPCRAWIAHNCGDSLPQKPPPNKALRLATCIIVRDNPYWHPGPEVGSSDGQDGCSSSPYSSRSRSPRGQLLLTRRAAFMRTFGGYWVFPGGRVDPGEEFWQAGLREVREETGLHLEPASLRPFCAWESCFPDNAPGAAHYIVSHPMLRHVKV